MVLLVFNASGGLGNYWFELESVLFKTEHPGFLVLAREIDWFLLSVVVIEIQELWSYCYYYY
jgi:hypothetical protein